MRLDLRSYMSVSTNSDHVQPENGINGSQIETMVLSDGPELPSNVANVSHEELRRYAQCKRVGNYLLGRTVGEGSFAKVKEAIHILTGEKVAIKIIDKNRARKDRYVSKNMRREARLLQMIRHPHIVQLLEIVETSQCYYLVFEFADGGDLMDHICKRKKLEEDEVRKFVRQIISAVEYLHRLGIMHRDLKVENILLDANKNIKIIDFGLSNTIYSPDPNNENHCTTQCGSPAYAAPELLVRKDYGPQIDVWSIGVNLYAMLTGRLPYTVEPFNISTLYNKMLKREMNVIPEYLSEACRDMILQLLNPNPKERLHILEAVRHRWITMDQKDPLVLTSCPNYLCEEDLDDRILDHVEEQLKLNSDDVIRDVIQNKATKNSCVYHLLVRRLERYKREERKLITTPAPTIQTTEEKPLANPEHKPVLTNHHATPQKNGMLHEKRSSHKTHIMENPFKTIKVALIRQKKAVKNEEKSKQASSERTSTVSHSTSNSEPANKPKLCSVKRVALVKFSPARRSLRGLTSGSRNSPKPGRRKYFEGLQHRRKSPKVRRRHAEPPDSSSSTISNSRPNSINTDNIAHNSQRMRIEDQLNNNSTVPNCGNSKSLVPGEYVPGNTSDTKPTNDTLPLVNIPEISTHVRDKDHGENASETVTHFYTDKGVVLKRADSSEGNGNHGTNYTQEQNTVQYHVFHGGDRTGNAGDVKDERGCQRINAVNSKQGSEKVVNAKISSVPAKAVETMKPTSQRQNSSNTPTSRQTPRNQTVKEKITTSKQTEQKPVAPRRPSSMKLDNSSKIPVLAGKKPAFSRQSPLSPTRLVPRTPSVSTANTRLPGTAARRNDVAALADKYNKCVSVIVVDRSSATGKGSSPARNSSSVAGKTTSAVGKSVSPARKCSLPSGNNSSATGKGSANDRNTTKGIPAKVVGGESSVNNSKYRNGLMEIAKTERAGVAKGSSLVMKEKKESTLTSKENGEGANLKSGGNNIKGKTERVERIDEKGTEKKSGQNVERIQDQANRRPSLVKSAKESLIQGNASRIVSKDSKQVALSTRRSSTSDRIGKISTAEKSRRSTPGAKDTASWTGDERRKISNYKKTNEPQQTKPAITRESKIAESVR